MRFAMIAVIALGLAACDSGEVPSPAERQGQASVAAPVADDEVVLRGEGLVSGSEAFYFAAGKTEVMGALAQALGEPVSQGSNDECGAGPMTTASFDGGLKVNFQQDRLVGWYHVGESEQIEVAGEVQIGTLREEAMAASGFGAVTESTLGEEFYIGPHIGGFMDDVVVTVLYAGTQCFFR